MDPGSIPATTRDRSRELRAVAVCWTLDSGRRDLVLTQRHSFSLVLALLLLVSVKPAEAQYCPAEPKWDAVPCSIYNVWDHKRATDNAYTLQRVSATANFRRWSWESNYGPPIEIAIWNYRGWREKDYKAAANMLAQALRSAATGSLGSPPHGDHPRVGNSGRLCWRRRLLRPVRSTISLYRISTQLRPPEP